MQEVNQLGRAGSCFAVLFLGACHATPQLQLSAADSMDLLAASLQTSLDEYRDDVNDFDEERRIAVIDAFVARVRADHDIFMVPYAKGSPLDPASYDPAGGSNLVTKMGIDATRKSNYPDEIAVPGFEAINMADFIPGYLGS